jgi:class 3 adenylate cyclase/pimeloyl-ACP methyl ester carboxylesterase
MKLPEVSYARSGDLAIAYQVIGEGPIDLVFARGFAGDLVSTWEQPLLVRHIEALSSFSRVLMLDKRGSGLSDRVREVPTLETRMDDYRAVMDDAGSEQAMFWIGTEGARLAALFAATYPERTLGLALINPTARSLRTDEYPWAPTDEEWRRTLAEVRGGWGRRDYLERLLLELAPTKANDDEFRDWFVWHMRRSFSPGAALAFFRMMMASDVTDVLSAVRVPTLILYGADQVDPARYFADRIAGAELEEIPGLTGEAGYTWLDSATHDLAVGLLRDFAARLRPRGEPERVLVTLLFVDMVGSTERAASIGDRAWREELAAYHALVRREVARFRGREIDDAGDGFLVSFDGPARAVRCARVLSEAAHRSGLEVRAGIHTGECEVHGQKLAGIAVHIGARIASLADPGQVLVSNTVKDLVAGSGLEFDDRGEHELKGVPGPWHLYAADRDEESEDRAATRP